jgi:alanyl-tRNA synthetase
MAQEEGLGVDMDGYERLMREHEEASRASAASLTGTAEVVAEGTIIKVNTDEIVRPGLALTTEIISSDSGKIEERVFGLRDTDDTPKWSISETEGDIVGWLRENKIVLSGSLGVGQAAGLVLHRTCFYAEAGGQVGDKGTITTPTGRFEVTHTVKIGRSVVHIGAVVSGRVEIGQTAQLKVDLDREFTRKNHTATHLLHWALHQVLGEHVEQRGSKVKPDEFTFDFSHTGPMTDAEKGEVERLVNEKIYQDLPVQWRELPIAEAKKLPGVRAFFGDKYGDVVRVIEIGDGFSREFCGGTHLEHTGQAGFFKIVGEEAVGKGVRRLTCVTAREAVATVQKQDAILTDLTGRFRCKVEELPARIDVLQEEIKKLQQQLKKGAATDLQSVADKLLASAAEVKGTKVIVGEMPAGPEEQMRQQVDRLRQKAGSAVVVLGWSEDSKVQLIAAVTDDLVKKGVHAGKLVGQVAKVVGGGGGGKPTMAQAGGKEPAKLAEALELAKKLAREQMGQ